jgi:putative ABC transport system permease protein
MEKTSPLVTTFYQQLLERVAVLPGVASVGFMSEMVRGITFSIMGRPLPAPDRRPNAAYAEVSPSFFHTLRIPLKKGRYLSESDRGNMPWAAVINETFARRYFPKQDPIGQRLLLRYESYHIDEERPREIVGVVGDVKHFGLGENSPPFVYASYFQQPGVFPGGCTMSHIAQSIMTRVAPGSSLESDFASNIKKAAAKIDPDQPLTNIMTMNRFLAGSIDDSQFMMRLLEIFAGMALLLAAIGIYGVMSYFVSERTHEIGIRIALGAERASVLGLVTGLGLKLTIIGVAIGAALAFALTRLIARFLFGVSPADPTTFAAVAVVLLSVALLACYLPARRATKVDPMVALRHE